MTSDRPSIVPFGDAALLVRFEERIDPSINAAVHALAREVLAERARGRPWQAPVPAYASLLVPYDPLEWRDDEAIGALHQLVATVDAGVEVVPRTATETPLEVPVRYGGDDGPDLAEVAERCGLSQTQVVDIHASTTYRAYLLGFAPGFAYLGTVPERIQLPRRETPRQRVGAGSVAIAGQQTAVYPVASPGGWHLIGRTGLRIWDPLRDQPALIVPDTEVRFVPLVD